MAIYKYTAIDRTGKKIQGSKEAETKSNLIDSLLSQGFSILTIDEDFAANFKGLLEFEIGGFSLDEKVIIAKQLATMITAGIPIIQAIDILRQQAEKPAMQKILTEVYRKIEAGTSLSKAFEAAKGVFSPVQISLIAAGEKSGNLNQMLVKVAEDMDKSKQLKGKVIGALIYPIIVFIVLIIVIVAMIAFMVPQVEELYQSLGKTELPLITRILVSIGTNISNPIVIMALLVIIVGAILGYKLLVSKPDGKYLADKMKLKIPIFGNLIAKIQISEFTRILAMLMASGIPIIQAIEIVSLALSNSVFSRTVAAAKNDIIKGATFSIGLAKNNKDGAIPVILLKMISVGEESGNMDKVLNDMYAYYNAEVEQITSNLTKLLEPIILVIVGVFVAFLAVAIYLPIYGIGDI